MARRRPATGQLLFIFESAPGEREAKVITAEESVTTRILKKAEEEPTEEKWQQRVAGRTGWKRG